jgi:hypothetical protein
VPFTGKGLRLAFTLTGTDTYTLSVTDNGNVTTLTGTLAGTGPLDSLALYNRNAGDGSAYDVFFNSLRLQSD